MSDYYDNDDNQSDGPKALREAFEKQKKQLADALKAIEAANERAEKAEKSVKSQSLNSLLSERKVPQGLAKFMGDIEPTAEAIDAWLKENGELFNLKPKVDEPAEDVEDELEDEDGIDPELAEALGQSAALDAQGTSRPTRQINEAINKLPDSLSFEEGVAQMRQLGIFNQS